jgi:tetraacyldisaccharide 4'-kinase
MTLIEQIWFKKHKAYWFIWPLLKPLSALYLVIASRRRKQYESGQKAQYHPSVPVIVVGNITVGGNGKTPVVVYLVERLKALGYKPGVVSRGYGAKAPYYPFLVSSLSETKYSGDEPKLIATRTRVPVVVDPVRSEAAKLLLKQGVDCIVTDDGLQHYALGRDLEIVVIDGARRFGNSQILPLGPLRESKSRLEEVDLLITNGGQAKINEMQMSLSPGYAINLLSNETKPASELGTCAAFAGIGHPQRFFDMLNTLKVDVQKTKGFADHKAVTTDEIVALSENVDSVLMTEKDAVKLEGLAKSNWWYLPVSASFSAVDEQKIDNEILKVLDKYGS